MTNAYTFTTDPEFEGKSYTVYHSSLSWDSARSYCQVEGRDLVAFETEAEWNFVVALVATRKHVLNFIQCFVSTFLFCKIFLKV